MQVLTSDPLVVVARVGIVILGVSEGAVTIMAASIPVMRMLVLRFRHHNPDQVSNRHLGKLQILRTRSKKPSVDVTTPSDATSVGAIILRQEEIGDSILFARTESDGRHNVEDGWDRQESHELGPPAARVESGHSPDRWKS